MYKKIILFVLCLFIFSNVVHAQDSDIKVFINNNELKSEVKPVLVDNSLYVPMRAFFESLNYDIVYEAETKTVGAFHIEYEPMHLLTFVTNQKNVTILYNGELRETILDEETKIINESLFIPIRTFGNLIGAETKWDGQNKIVSVEINKSQMTSGILKTFANAQIIEVNQPNASGNLVIYADDGTYLGKLSTNKYDVESIFNEFGTYGSEFSVNSIWNEFGIYGGEFSIYSPFNEFSNTPPIIYLNGEPVGYLTVNDLIEGSISPNGLYEALEETGY